MSAGSSTAHSVVEPSRRSKQVAAVLVIAYALISLLPLVWIFLTGLKSPPELQARVEITVELTLDRPCRPLQVRAEVSPPVDETCASITPAGRHWVT